MFAKLMLLLLPLCFVGCQAVAPENQPDCTALMPNFAELVEVPEGSICYYSDTGTYEPMSTRATWYQLDRRYGCAASNAVKIARYKGCWKVKPKNPAGATNDSLL